MTDRNLALRERIPTVTLGGMPIARISRAETADLVCALAARRHATHEPPVVMSSANGQVLSECARKRELRALFDQADVLSADGQPMVLLSRLLTRTPVADRCATTDLFHDVSKRLPHGARYFLLGSTGAELARALLTIQRLYPHIAIVGARDGYFSKDEEPAIVEAINEAAPDVLWIAMGVPRELAFALKHRDRLIRVKVIKTSGGLFNFLSGSRSRAPRLMQEAGLEWLWRLMLEPRRLFVRYLTTNVHSLVLLLTRTR
jgi:N-acetylglucosaminyldiphosphoundecaprenol N-acetyl-beta-D-mannosaminyltransferase